MPDITETPSSKGALRTAALALRDALPAAARQAAAEAIAARSFPLKIAAGVIVSGFAPMKTEINPIPLMRKLPTPARNSRFRLVQAAASR